MILFFTGTGNSEYVARRLGAALSDPVVPLAEKIRRGDHTPLSSGTPWVVCAPTYAWDLPRVVRDWLLETPLLGSRKLYFVLTCGGDVGGAAAGLKKICREKGMNFYGLRKIVMPENYVAMFKVPAKEEARRIIEAAEPEIDETAGAIRLRAKLLSRRPGPLAKLQSGPVNRGFYAHYVTSRKFRVTEACTGCGLCERICPLGAVTLRDGRPEWTDPCTHCMACICHCPAEAIEYGKTSVGKPRYRCPVSVDLSEETEIRPVPDELRRAVDAYLAEREIPAEPDAETCADVSARKAPFVESFSEPCAVPAPSPVSAREEAAWGAFPELSAAPSPSAAPRKLHRAPAANEGICGAAVPLEERLRSPGRTFQELLLQKIDASGLPDSEVYRRADIDRRHFSKIRSNPDYRPKKPTVFALALALRLNEDETADLLGRAGYAFSPALRQDLIVQYCIEHGIFSLTEVNSLLFAYDQPLLGGRAE